jgi:PAS domain S-box-containing protein
MASTEDITERKRAQEALEQASNRFKLVTLATQDAVFDWDFVSHEIWRNEAYQRTFGAPERSLDSENWWVDRLHPEDRERVLTAQDTAFASGGNLFSPGYRLRRPDGSYADIVERSLIVRDAKGQVVRMIGALTDVSERKRAEEALEESEARFRAVFENAAIGIALVDVHGYTVESNPALQKMLGYNKTELAQMAFTEFTHPDDVQASWNLFMELGEGKRDRYQLEKRYCRKDGQIVWGQLTESLVRNQNGEPQYAIAMIEDISGRKRAAEALRQLSGRLLRLQDEERRRIARELHDTTAQSLAALAMNLSVVKESAPDLSPRARTCLSESLELSEECSREIRTLSYLLHPPLLDEAGLGSALRWFVDGYTQRRGIHVDLEMPPELTRLPGDIELALYRVVQEALTNIHLHSGSKTAHVCLKCRPDQAVLTVADEGRGMPPGLLERGGRRGAKLGVGIPGMRERIRQLGGQFEIVSGSNGTTLTAIVPLIKEQA